jgi:hypothetical protein
MALEVVGLMERRGQANMPPRLLLPRPKGVGKKSVRLFYSRKGTTHLRNHKNRKHHDKLGILKAQYFNRERQTAGCVQLQLNVATRRELNSAQMPWNLLLWLSMFTS